MTQPTIEQSWPYGGPLDHAEGVGDGNDAPTYPASDASSMPLVTGNPNDDDAEVFQAYLEAAANPPLPVEQKEVVNPNVKQEMPSLLMTETQTFDPTWGIPVLIAPRDTRRKSITVTVFSSSATDYLRLADDNGKVSTDRGSFRVYSANPWSGPHTGAVWGFLPSTASGLVVVTTAIITESTKES
jgi:hypothetical protein